VCVTPKLYGVLNPRPKPKKFAVGMESGLPEVYRMIAIGAVLIADRLQKNYSYFLLFFRQFVCNLTPIVVQYFFSEIGLRF
jgi:hypothetical protein